MSIAGIHKDAVQAALSACKRYVNIYTAHHFSCTCLGEDLIRVKVAVRMPRLSSSFPPVTELQQQQAKGRRMEYNTVCIVMETR